MTDFHQRVGSPFADDPAEATAREAASETDESRSSGSADASGGRSAGDLAGASTVSPAATSVSPAATSVSPTATSVSPAATSVGGDAWHAGPLRYTALGAVFAAAICVGFAAVAAWYFPTGAIAVATLGSALGLFGLRSPRRITATSLVLIHLGLFLWSVSRVMA